MLIIYIGTSTFNGNQRQLCMSKDNNVLTLPTGRVVSKNSRHIHFSKHLWLQLYTAIFSKQIFTSAIYQPFWKITWDPSYKDVQNMFVISEETVFFYFLPISLFCTDVGTKEKAESSLTYQNKYKLHNNHNFVRNFELVLLNN